MNAMLARTTRIALVALTLGGSFSAIAGQELMDIDSHFRAKIAKEKIKSAAEKRKADEQGQAADQSSCGSQAIGNVQTTPGGAAPREVFVFAPNAINIVGNGGCR